MSSAPSPFPCLESLAPDGVLDSLSSLEVGALYRLLRFAWRQDPPCTLPYGRPEDDSFLSMVARITSEEWAASKMRLLLALTARPGAIQDGRLVLSHALGVYQQLEAHTSSVAARRRQQTAAATEARRRRCTTSTLRERHDDVTTTSRQTAPSVRSVLNAPPALSLNRSSQRSLIQSAPSAHASAQAGAHEERVGEAGGREDVIAVLGEGARAILAEKVRAWRREKALRLLQEAIARWRTLEIDGRLVTTCPISKAQELAEGQYATPARVQAVIEDADGKIAHARSTRGTTNPVAVVIHGLGMSARSRGKPAAVPLFIETQWARIESETLKTLEAQASINARLAQARSVMSELNKDRAEARHG